MSAILQPTQTEEEPEILRLQAVGRRYADTVVLGSVDFRMMAGERVALMGPSGSGKTTLLNCIGGIDRPDKGSIWIDGDYLEAMSSDELALMRRRKLSSIFQFFHLLPTLTVYENVEFPLQLLGVRSSERRNRVMELLDAVRLGDRTRAYPSELSGGEMQRVAIARALAPRPKLVLADEPTGNLDSATGGIVLEFIRTLASRFGTALLLVTHDDEAARICGRIVRLKEGRLFS